MSFLYVVKYNGVSLLDSQITEWQTDYVFDESGVAKLYDHTKCTVKGLASTSTYFGQLGGNPTMAAILTYLRQQLSEPRQVLTISIGGLNVISTPNGGDAKWGPKISNLSVLEIRGATVVVSFTVECWLAECPGGGTPPNVICSRWMQSQDIDDKGYSTITTDGYIILRSNSGQNPDLYRSVISPVRFQPAGFIRKQKYQVTSDGLRLNYNIVDHEEYKPPTNGITFWDGGWDEASDMQSGNGAMMNMTLHLEAAAPKTMSKADLFTWLVNVALSRLNFTGNTPDIIRSYKVHESLSHNEMSLDVQVLAASSKNISDFKMTTRIGSTLSQIDNGTQTTIGAQGTYLASLWYNTVVGSCTAQDGGSTGTRSPAAAPVVTIIPPYDYAPNQNVNPQTGNNISQQQMQNPYIKAKIELVDDEDYHTIQLPVASPNADCVYATLAAPTTEESVMFDVERLNAPPDLPAFVTNGRTVLRATVVRHEPEILPDGTNRIYGAHGKYVLGLDKTAMIGTNPVSYPLSLQDKGPIGLLGQSNYTDQLPIIQQSTG